LTKFQAVVGRTYQLHVQTEDGKMYRSKPEFVRAVPKLDKIYTEFNRIPIGSGANVIGEFSVYVDLKDSSTTKDFYRWESIHWEQLKYCEHYSVIAELPAKIYGQPCCETCYEFSVCKECKPTQSDRLMNGNTIKKLIAKIPYDTLSPYFLNIKQFSISESTFLYLNSIENQAQNTGGLFDVTPKQVRGNISNINDAEEEVLGYFSATDLVEKTIYFERNIPNFRPFPRFKPIEVLLCYPCIERYRRTKSPPKNWIK
jgi:hypothetical protein